VVNLRDRDKAPIPGLKYEIRVGKKIVKKGKTDGKGLTSKIAVPHGQTPFDVFVARIEGGMKQIASFAAPMTSAVVTLISPKVRIDAALEKHKGEPGTYRAGRASAGTSTTENGKAKTSPQRGAKGNPVAVTHAPPTGARVLSGAAWESHFPTSKSLDDLNPHFREKVSTFIEALKAAGIRVRIAATFRPKERAYLMHYCCKIANGGIRADKVPPMDGVNIEWAHRDAAGKLDVQASRAAAREMMQAYVIRYPAALSSRHTQRRAIDMTIIGFKDKTVKGRDGEDVKICSRDDLHALGRTYGVIKLLSDPPHWSDDGH
jgi:hypothetical protein